jgi:hypothetical protein
MRFSFLTITELDTSELFDKAILYSRASAGAKTQKTNSTAIELKWEKANPEEALRKHEANAPFCSQPNELQSNLSLP